jgi:hypothetical protein
MAIPADGRKVAFADPSALAVVTLESNSYEGFTLPVQYAVGLAVSPD